VVGFFVSWWSLKSKALVGMVLASGVYSMFASLAVVWYSGYPVDAILLTMPSLVYVATTSGAIHLANYYRDQLAETGVQEGAAGRAVHHALLPLSLATGTTAVGLATLAVSELVPIKMFGIFSAVGVVVSFVILVTFMPAALELFPPKLRLGKLGDDEDSAHWKPIEQSRWWHVGQWITRHNGLVATACLLVMLAVGYGMTRVESSVQLMRLFSPKARIREDYRWLETKLGPLVPMEILVRIDQEDCSLNFLERRWRRPRWRGGAGLRPRCPHEAERAQPPPHGPPRRIPRGRLPSRCHVAGRPRRGALADQCPRERHQGGRLRPLSTRSADEDRPDSRTPPQRRRDRDPGRLHRPRAAGLQGAALALGRTDRRLHQ
jgi:hypothetical protein